MAHQIEADVYYPESDGQPMGETEVHRQLLMDLVFTLMHWLARRADAHVSGNLFIYYVQGDPKQVICPDVFVAFGSHKRRLDTYRTWRDGPFPQVVIELTSSSTRAEDHGPKRALYERLGVLEYYLFDPHFDPNADDPDAAGGDGSLVRYRRASATQPFEPAEALAPGATLHSDLLELGFTVRGKMLRLVDEATGSLLPIPDEEAAERAAAQAERAAAEAARAAAERQRRAAERTQRATEAAREAAEAQAQAQRAAREQAEARARALAEELARLRAERDGGTGEP